MRLADTEFTSRPWRVHDVAPDFALEDVWELPTPGGPDDLDRLVHAFAGGDGSAVRGGIVGFLFAARWKLGELFGWDAPGKGVGDRVHSLRERLPSDLADGPRGPDVASLPFTSVFQTHDEWVAELANGTVHALMHIGWVPDEAGVYRAQMSALVRPNGWGGRLYMALIAPLRRTIVYPRMLRAIGRRWQEPARA
ncbi:DUF2867 domain-containing protein [Cellulomonas humilata]|uniref:DUF2867 domain-containing protein n=1 Tax=Cellulomonas humilata TaxID=144055 RepID=A0ABU0EIV6_9CELL|nr:DUF2867 domain-containing protein [Cellulomonas humilata]MDQ0375207.1 hypothetical protein [Cellulomonas humilata]